MKKLAALFLVLLALSAVARAGSAERYNTDTPAATPLPPVPLNIFDLESGYVFESNLTDGRDRGEQDAFHFQADYGHRFLLSGNLYLHLGLAYERFDFGQSSAPLPDHLQAFSGVIGLDYMHGKDVGAFISVRPGFYTEDRIGIATFDAPITGGRIFVLQPDKLYLFVGANVSFLRGRLPVLPIGGIIWEPNEQWKISALLPEPRIIYSPTKALQLWGGGELVGGSFRTDPNNIIRPARLSNAEVDYSEYRVGAGLIYSPANMFSVDLGGGYAIERTFNFERADKRYTTDPAPYLRLEFNARF
ncbi:MAG: hypothetical protein ABI795_05340 [Chthoniobacterales bacterium]|nr:hypothetical protein [Chthoniobacterales bacterium]